jgi:hypothetical protein
MDEQRRNDPDVSTSYLGVVLALLFIGGCCSTGAQRELEQVAKNWSMTIRASQVIPLYPLTEDVQPGDIFLVQVSVDDQQKVFSEKGFLPLDNHIGRTPSNRICEVLRYAIEYGCSLRAATRLV